MTEHPQEPLNIQEKRKEFKLLLESPAWHMITVAIQAQVDSLQQEILFSSVESQGAVYMLERKKGMLEGRLALAATANAMLEDLEIDLQRALTKE